MKKDIVFKAVLVLAIFLLVYQFGIKPLIGDILFGGVNKNKYIEAIPGSSSDVYDVIVFGEEPDGIAAAVAAARLGARVLLLSGGNDLGGVVEDSLLTNLELPLGSDGEILNKGMLTELTGHLGRQFSILSYKSVIYTFTNNEKSLEIKYDCKFVKPFITGHTLTGLRISSAGVEETVNGRMFIDSSRDGLLLEACKVPFFKGSEDLNLKDSYLPVSFNFSMRGKDSDKIKKLLQDKDSDFSSVMAKYEPLNINADINNFRIYDKDTGSISITGLEFVNVNVDDEAVINKTYKHAVEEGRNLALYLAKSFEAFKGWEFSLAADTLYIPEYRHFIGISQLGVTDVLENSFPANTISMGTYPVLIGKFANGVNYVAGKPTAYGIPLGCLLTNEVDNLMMTGAKASYSSLAASSAGTLGTSVTTGESAGITAVYCLVKGTDLLDIITDKDQEKSSELKKYLEKQGLVFKKAEVEDANFSNWTYPALRELLSLGLVSGGMGNDYKLDNPATAEDLALILLNGVYRLDKEKYTLTLDSLLRPYFVKDKLTREKAAEILQTMYSGKKQTAGDYQAAGASGYINEVLQLRLKDKQVLTLDDVYYLGAYNLKLYTGKTIVSSVE